MSGRRYVGTPRRAMAALGLLSHLWLGCSDDDSTNRLSAADSVGGSAGSGGTGASAGSAGTSTGGGGSSSGASGASGGASGASGSAGASGATAGASGSAGSGGTAGVGGSGGMAGSAGGGGTAGVAPPGPGVCGDGWRHLDSPEECDDGSDSSSDDLCFSCTVQDALAVSFDDDPPGLERSPYVLGHGRHTVAANGTFIGVVFLETVNGEPTLGLSTFDAAGHRAETFHDIGVGSSVLWESDPVVAALEDGSFVVAWTDFDGDGDELGIVLRKISPGAASPLGPLVRGNSSTEFSQYHPDLIWTGSNVVLSWMDGTDPFSGPDLKTRTFTSSLAPSTTEKSLAHQDGAEGSVSLCSFAGGYAASWRDAFAGAETLHVQSGDAHWSVSVPFAGPADEPPALVALDDHHLLLAYSLGVDVDSDGIADRFSLRARVLAADDVSYGDELDLEVESYATTIEPTLVQVGTRWFLSVRTEALQGDPAGDELWFAEVSWSPSDSALTVGGYLPLPRQVAHRDGDQRRPALAAASYWPEGALAAVWSDFSGSWGEPPQPVHEEVVVELIPLPIVRAE